jgi:hypothetical protein
MLILLLLLFDPLHTIYAVKIVCARQSGSAYSVQQTLVARAVYR